MKVAHVCIVTPGRCGLYETTRELLKGLRARGIDSRLIDIPRANKMYGGKGYPKTSDRDVPVQDMAWAVNADVVVNHSGYDGTPIAETDQPIVHVCHGRPRSSFISERSGSTPIYSYHFQKNRDPRFKSVVTFWPEHVPYWELMFPDKPVVTVPAPCDLEHWSPGPDQYDFHGKRGEFNIVLTDAWRDDVDPFYPLHAAALYARKRPGTKIHVYAVPENRKGFDVIFRRIEQDGNLGVLVSWSPGLREVYRSADVLFTGNTIDTRSVREAMACGCPVVRINETLQVGDIESRRLTRARAVDKFSIDSCAAEFELVVRNAA